MNRIVIIDCARMNTVCVWCGVVWGENLAKSFVNRNENRIDINISSESGPMGGERENQLD